MSFIDNLRRDIANRLNKVLTSRTGNAPVMMMLGGFKFSVRTAAAHEVSRRRGFRWAAQERFGNVDALQFTGYNEEVWNFACVVYPDWQGIKSTDEIIEIAPENRPLKLISASGDIIGKFVIVGIEETGSYFKTDGTPRKIEFNLTIRAYD